MRKLSIAGMRVGLSCPHAVRAQLSHADVLPLPTPPAGAR